MIKLARYWLRKVERDNKKGIPNIYNLNKAHTIGDKIIELSFK